MVIRIKRWLYLAHRWLGIVLCLFLAMWFLSGVVMMYVGYPKLTEAERLAHLPALPADTPLLSPAAALRLAGVAGELRELTLSAGRAGAPVYHVVGADGGRLVVDAAHGRSLPSADAGVALASARAFGAPGVDLEYRGMIDEDAFTHSRALDGHRPLHRIDLGDPAGTRLYVSGTTGEVVRDASRRERGWNYLGAWIHWLYPFRGNVFDGQWANIVNGLSIAGLVLAATGTAVGILRWRFTRPYRNGSRTPYPGSVMRWHHMLGLGFALITLTWLFSGLMSMGPWGFLRTVAPALNQQAMHGVLLKAGDLTTSPGTLLAGDDTVRELRWVRRLGHAAVSLHGAAGGSRLADAHSGAPLALEQGQIVAAASRLLGAPVVRTETLRAYDLYYYARQPHTMTGGRDRPLPAIRVVFGDAHATWVHVDAATADVLGRLDDNGRLRRWLFGMLHSWDWLPLLERRPLWDAVLIILSAGGFGLSLSGVVIGLRRLRPGARVARGARALAGRRADAR